MKNKKPIKNRFLYVLIRIPLYILLSPFLLIRSIGRFVAYILKNLKLSIRRRITFHYLVLYAIVGIITLGIIVASTAIFDLKEKSDTVGFYVDKLLENYSKGLVSDEEFHHQVNYLAQKNNCGIQLNIKSQDVFIKSDHYSRIGYPNGFVDRISLLFRGMYPDQKKLYFARYDAGVMEVVTMNLLHPIKPHYEKMSKLSVVLLFCLGGGFIFIWFFGSLNNKRILKPIYDMTRTAEKITISNMNQELDVDEAKYELKDLAITLNAMISRLQKDYDKQKRFVSDVSHELRTPISIINGYAGMLKRWGKEDEAILDESITAIIDEAKNMQVLVENLLTLVRADNQTLKFKREDFFIDQLIGEVVTESQMINNKEQTISYSILEPMEVYLDHAMIKQTLRIFVDNAVKYTPNQGAVSINLEREDGQCAIKVRDTGIGIDSQDLPFIFDRFYRSDESRTRETGGHGLGLSIAKAIVLGQGGKIKVKSKKNEGSEFTILLPLKETI